jgi:hypothetical protein
MEVNQQVELVAHITCCREGKSLEELSELLQEALDLVQIFLARKSVSVKQLQMSITLKHREKSLEVISQASPTLLTAEVKLSPHSVKQDPTEEVSSLGDTDPTEELVAAKQEQSAAEVSSLVSPSFIMSAELEAKLKVEEPSYSDEERLPMKRQREGTLSWPNGDEYQGELLHDLPHGKGTMKYTGISQRTYVGDWVNGVREGHGSFLFKDGRSYVGEWADDKKHGTGTSTYFNGQVYTGSWRHGKIHGHGVLVYPDGAVYEGRFSAEHKSGKGTIEWPDGRVFRGSWYANKRQGRGLEEEPDGVKYTGTWDRGEKHGDFTYEKEGSSRCETWCRGELSHSL